MSLVVKIKKQLDNFLLDTDIEADDEVLALSGMSGAGKTMTLKCIAGIEKADSGFISLNGRVLFDSEKKINLSPGLRKTGYLFQDYALFPTMTARENINIVMKKNSDMTDKWLEKYGLMEVADNLPEKLSGGQKQRIAILRIFASEPECLLLDEPFSALDEHIKRKMERELMEMLADFHKPIIFVSHNREEIYRIADRVCNIENGVTDNIRDKKEFFEKPQTTGQAKITGCINISEIKWLDEEHVYSKQWDNVFDVAYVNKEKWHEYRYIGIFPKDIFDISDGDDNIKRQMSAMRNDITQSDLETINRIDVVETKTTEELLDISVNCRLKNDSFITMNLPKQLYKANKINNIGILKKDIHLLG